MKKQIISGIIFFFLIGLCIGYSGVASTQTGNWWNKFGTPQYGDRIVVQAEMMFGNFDPSLSMDLCNYEFDSMFFDDWTLDREIYSFQDGPPAVPEDYHIGLLAESWEWPDAQTMIVHLRKGIRWQNKPPTNGREFTAYDVEYHFDRLLGTGSGFTQPNASWSRQMAAFQKVYATDNDTVVYKFNKPSFIYNFSSAITYSDNFEAKEAVSPTNLYKDWRTAVGTGPWIIADWVSGSSMTLDKNPDYWYHDERYPENKIPYADQVVLLCIPDKTTAMAALRTRKIDALLNLSWQQAETLANTNPELMQASHITSGGYISLNFRREPFSDIRVRKALQMAIDREAIAKSYYNGLVDWKPTGILYPPTKGYIIPYDDWPQEFKDEYSYNPTKAKQLLAEAGYPQFPMNVIMSSGWAGDVNLAQIIKSYFKDIGVNMEISVMEDPTFMALTREMKLEASMEVAPGYFGTRMSIDMWRSNSFMGAIRGDAGYDALADKYNNAASVAEAKKVATEIQMYCVPKHWMISVTPLPLFNTWQPYLKGYSGEYGLTVRSSSGYWARIWIDQDLK